MADPLTPFIETLARVAIPVLLGAVVIGGVLGLLFRGAENRLVRLIRGFRRRGGQAAPKNPPATGRVPSCPICNSGMVSRRARRGAYTGTSFWGCSRYPECKGNRPSLD